MTDEDCNEEYSTNKTKTEPEKKRQNPLQKLRDRFKDYLKDLLIVDFNSGRYDLNAVKKFLFPVLVRDEEVQSTIKRNHNFMCLLTEHLCFLDFTNLLALGFSYDNFLRAYKCPQTKGFFPYEWMDSLFSSLTNTNISAEDYQFCQQVWTDNKMQTFRDFLIWCNSLHVNPFSDAFEKNVCFLERETYRYATRNFHPWYHLDLPIYHLKT